METSRHRPLGLPPATIGDAAPEALDWDGPGPVLFTLLALLVAFVPGRFMLLLSPVFILGVLANPEPPSPSASPAPSRNRPVSRPR
ncbi:hypothetical protein GCM10009678_55500 [Actinomadura kijaniata]|uniref:Uncharacterized protein n=1 Tax=Actinomadura namibiensis TaxID=182080 RepID=A0A7W3QKS8_ACTNM|nr:hypothetical protein [Actinomadura namibiensis]MBA8950233.1 hypothetical protein [Actinomadura namibiensis]